MSLSGSPNLLTISCKIIMAVSNVFIVFLHSLSIIPFIRPWSTMTIIESNPSGDIDRMVRKTIDICEKGLEE